LLPDSSCYHASDKTREAPPTVDARNAEDKKIDEAAGGDDNVSCPDFR
jgi:hypothetical protein